MIIAVSSFGESLRRVPLTASAEAAFKGLQFLIDGGQYYRESRASPRRRFDPNAALVVFDDRFYYCQSQSRARDLVRDISTSEEFVEDKRLVVKRDARPVIGNLQDNLAPSYLGIQADSAIPGGIFDGISEQVVQHLL